MKVTIYQCKKCHWKWANRMGRKPHMCPNPKCHTVLWDEDRRR